MIQYVWVFRNERSGEISNAFNDESLILPSIRISYSKFNNLEIKKLPTERDSLIEYEVNGPFIGDRVRFERVMISTEPEHL